MSAAKEKYKLFALSYIVDGNAAQAAIKAGYSRKCARQQGTRLLANADIRKMIDEARAKAIAEAEEKALLSYR